MYLWAQEKYHTICELVTRAIPPHFLQRLYSQAEYRGDWNNMNPIVNENANHFVLGWNDNAEVLEQQRQEVNEAKQTASRRLTGHHSPRTNL